MSSQVEFHPSFILLPLFNFWLACAPLARATFSLRSFAYLIKPPTAYQEKLGFIHSHNSFHTLPAILTGFAATPHVAVRDTKWRVSVHEIVPYLGPTPLRPCTPDRPI